MCWFFLPEAASLKSTIFSNSSLTTLRKLTGALYKPSLLHLHETFLLAFQLNHIQSLRKPRGAGASASEDRREM